MTYLIANNGHLMHAVINTSKNSQHGVQGRLQVAIFLGILGCRLAATVLDQILENELNKISVEEHDTAIERYLE